ncbi:MAG: dethiobiotin synthase [Smithellaceae bacterium]|nr:dethiobiotin synthase [Smithellaceae bacterium]
MKGIFVTGTDTGAGKTIVGVALGLYLKQKGVPVKVVKPFETGCLRLKEQLIPQDGALYRLLLQIEEPLDKIVPFRYSQPLAPYQTSLIDKRPLNYGKALAELRHDLGGDSFHLLEGAGGIMVPLEENIFIVDLIADLQVPVLVVAPNRLGTINHTLLTLAALAARGIKNAGVILNEQDASTDQVKMINREYFQNVLGEGYLGEFPFLPGARRLVEDMPGFITEGSAPEEEELVALREELARSFAEMIKTDRLLSLYRQWINGVLPSPEPQW